MAVLQPARNEYQRYPGHPATTCLSTVLGNALGTYSAQNRAQFVKAFTDTVPRVRDVKDGPTETPPSLSGSSSMGGSQIPLPGPSPQSLPLTVDLDRLYASLDEFQFTPARTDQPQTLGGSSDATLLQQDVDTCRFFLTAHSKAPELNLFGLASGLDVAGLERSCRQRTNFEDGDGPLRHRGGSSRRSPDDFPARAGHERDL